MPAPTHPQAKFDPLPPDLDLRALVDQTTSFQMAQRVSRDQIRSLGQEQFEQIVLMHVVLGGKPLVVDGWNSALPKGLFSAEWLEKNYDKKRKPFFRGHRIKLTLPRGERL